MYKIIIKDLTNLFIVSYCLVILSQNDIIASCSFFLERMVLQFSKILLSELLK